MVTYKPDIQTFLKEESFRYTLFVCQLGINFTKKKKKTLRHRIKIERLQQSSRSMNYSHAHHLDHGNDDSHDMPMMMMSMSFHGGVNEVILFSFWKITTLGGLLGSIVGIFLLAILYEGLKAMRETMLENALVEQNLRKKNGTVIDHADNCRQGIGETSQNQTSDIELFTLKSTRHRLKPFSTAHIIQSTLHMIQLFFSYMLMLVVMTYNIWLLLAVIVGCGVGHLLFGWRRITKIETCEHCH
ncbi:High affinity copper uptake protein [Trichinella spiralis]|uniref:Copper transport protein n=1 Tax=Trichinella spiralis TaxID=6334 RepID=A0ABR3KVP3_TRISP